MADIINSPVDMAGVSVSVDTGGLFTPGAAFAIDTAAQVINAAWNQGLTKQGEFETKVTAAGGAWLDPATAPTVTASEVAIPSVTEPGVIIPASADVTDVMDVFDTKYLELVALLADKFALFRTTYFPDESTAYTAAEDWLQSALANDGLPAGVAAQILEDDRSRVLADATRASDSVLQSFAAMRFPMPPGAAAGAIVQIQQKAQGEIAATSRKLTMISVEQMRFAVEKTLALRQIAMGSAIDYIKALASGPDMASRLVNIGYDAQSKLISSAASFYNARTDAAKLVHAANEFNAKAEQGAEEKNQASKLEITADKLKALLTEAQALAQMSTALFNNVHASAGTSYGVNGT